jgi:hypothetical protein
LQCFWHCGSGRNRYLATIVVRQPKNQFDRYHWHALVLGELRRR